MPERPSAGGSETIRSFNRFELKYLLDPLLARAVEGDLAGRLLPDANGAGTGGYRLESLYFDSPDRRCYWEKLEGLKFRRKLRLRRYVSEGRFTEASPVFVEIKQRVDRVTQKRRLVLPFGAALALCAEGEEPSAVGQGRDWRPEDRSLVEEILVFGREYSLEPACLVGYRRRAFVGAELDPGLRVTFDDGLRAAVGDLRLGAGAPGAQVLPKGSVIMEIKANDRIPRWLTEIVAARNLRLVRISKYVACLDASADRAARTARLERSAS